MERWAIAGALGAGGSSSSSSSLGVELLGLVVGCIVFLALPFSLDLGHFIRHPTGYLSAYCGEFAILTALFLVGRAISSIVGKSFLWSHFQGVIPLIAGVLWLGMAGLGVTVLVRMAYGLDGGSVKLGIAQIGWVLLLIGGPLCFVAASVLSLPIVVIARWFR